jgi:hypothetical protein
MVLDAWRLRRGLRHLCVWTGLHVRRCVIVAEPLPRQNCEVGCCHWVPFLPHLSSALPPTSLEEDAEAARMPDLTGRPH